MRRFRTTRTGSTAARQNMTNRTTRQATRRTRAQSQRKAADSPRARKSTLRARQQRHRSAARRGTLFDDYQPLADTYDEYFDPRSEPRHGLRTVFNRLSAVTRPEFRASQRLADAAFRQGGITFSVYSDQRGVEKIFPFDLTPRIVTAADWQKIERGLEQRIRALNLFLADIYGPQRILAEGHIPPALIEQCTGYQPLVKGIRPRRGVYIHVAGIDLIRAPDGRFLVLEDNVRTPSGVSYVLENRNILKRVFPRAFAASNVQSISRYPDELRHALIKTAPPCHGRPQLAVMTPGPFNSAYFEHGFLARTMGVELVQGTDLFVDDEKVYMRTTGGPVRVHSIYRRIDDAFVDPTVFNPNSLLGVPGLFRAYAAGNVTLANAIGNGVADDKAIYAFVPAMIRFYLDENPLLDQVDTFVCADAADRRYVLGHLDQLVVKRVAGAGGYDMLMGPSATKKRRHAFAERIRANPREFIAQPLIELSTCPTWVKGKMVPRRVDLRPYVVTAGEQPWVLPGGLTRVALTEGSYVVNSSQGGGSKDTWVLAGRAR